MKKLIALTLIAVFMLSACETDADVARRNVSYAVEQFEVPRRIIAFNGITDKYLISVEGFCSVETGDSLLSNALEIICKVGPSEYKKHFVGLSDNVSFFVEQLEPIEASTYRYRVIFRPTVIVPDVELAP